MLILLFSTILSLAEAADIVELPPVFLFPGFLGSKLYVEGRNVHYPKGMEHCQNGHNIPFHKAWIGDSLLDAEQAECEFYRIGLIYNQSIDDFQDHQGITVSTHDHQKNETFGSLGPIQCLFWDLENEWICTASNFHPLIEWLKQIGFEEGKNLFGAAYDWRVQPNSTKLYNFYAQLKELIEEAVETTGKKALLVAHSYGNLIVNHFLHKWTSENWRSQFIDSTVNIAAPFGGSVLSLKSLLIGQQIGGALIFNERQVRNYLRTIASPAVLLPRPAAFDGEILLEFSRFASFTANQMPAFLDSLHLSHLISAYENFTVQHLRNITMHCIYGIGIETDRMYIFNSSSLDYEKPKVVLGDGDGLVNVESLRTCQRWKEEAGNEGKISVLELPGQHHSSIISSHKLFEHLHPLLIGKLRPNEHFASHKNHRRYKKSSNFLCISEIELAECQAGSEPTKWTRKAVNYACFEGSTAVEVGKIIEHGKNTHHLGRFIWGGLRTSTERMEAEIVPLICARYFH